MFRNLKIVVWALSLALVAAVPNEVSASCTGDYLVCLNGAYATGGGAVGTLAELECGAGWVGCVGLKMFTW
ncbi:MAG: hypothetical protein ACYC6F_13110 [Longimicrobiales bacterium]